MTDGIRRRGRPALARERILQTALQIIDDDGAEALTLRALAERMSSSTATLYRHVASRAELVDEVVDYILGEAASVPEVAAGWSTVCRDAAMTTFTALSHHSRAAGLLAPSLATGPNGMAIRERMLASLLRDGFPPIIAVKAVATISHYVLGFALQSVSTERAPETEGAGEDNSLRGAGAARFPATTSVLHLLPRPLEEEFEFGLELILHGLAGSLTSRAVK